MAAPVRFSLNAGQLPDTTLPCGRNAGQLAKWVRRLPDRRALLYAEDDGPGDQPYAIELFAALDLSNETPAQSLPRWLLDALTSPSATTTSTRRPRLSMIASATSRQRYREWWLTSGLPLDDSREPEPRLAWDTSDSEPEALERLEGWDGSAPENDG